MSMLILVTPIIQSIIGQSIELFVVAGVKLSVSFKIDSSVGAGVYTTISSLALLSSPTLLSLCSPKQHQQIIYHQQIHQQSHQIIILHFHDHHILLHLPSIKQNPNKKTFKNN